MQLEVYPSEIEEDNSIVAGDDVSQNYKPTHIINNMYILLLFKKWQVLQNKHEEYVE